MDDYREAVARANADDLARGHYNRRRKKPKTERLRAELELSCNTQLSCEKCDGQNFRICMDVNEETNELSRTLVNNVECSNCHALYQVNLIRETSNG